MGLLFIAIIWCLRGFLSYKQVIHNSCNMGTRGLPVIYTLSPQAGSPRVLGVYIRQTTRAHVTTIYNISIYLYIYIYILYIYIYIYIYISQ